MPAIDAHGAELKIRDEVRVMEFKHYFGDKAIVRRVEAIGETEPFYGMVCVTGILGWCKASRFEKVYNADAA